MSWYAVSTRSRHEYKANAGLVQKGMVTFLPEVEVWSKRKDRKKRITVPLFPGYLFTESACLSNEIKLSILKTFGVVRILGKKENAEPIAVPDSKIEAIQRLIKKKADVFSLQYPQVGEPARIVDGPFSGIEGIVVSNNVEKELFVVSIELLQRSVAIRMEGFQIRKI